VTQVVIGRITSPFGTRGEVKVLPETDWLCRFLVLEEATILREGHPPERLAVEGVRYHAGRVILKLKGVDDMTRAGGLRGAQIAVLAKERVHLPPGHYWIGDIVGMEVWLEEGERLGTVKDVLRPGANDVYVVDTGDGEVLVPATHEVVRNLDITRGRMTIRPIPGLLD
jgi:16S rRNA processing protein RimM